MVYLHCRTWTRIPTRTPNLMATLYCTETDSDSDSDMDLDPHCYRPQQSCEGYVFTPVCHSVHKGEGCLSACWDATHPPKAGAPLGPGTPPGPSTPWDQALPLEQAPPRSRPPGRRLLLRTVRILLECILVTVPIFGVDICTQIGI